MKRQKRAITKTEFERKHKMWAVYAPLIAGVIASATTLAIHFTPKTPTQIIVMPSSNLLANKTGSAVASTIGTKKTPIEQIDNEELAAFDSTFTMADFYRLKGLLESNFDPSTAYYMLEKIDKEKWELIREIELLKNASEPISRDAIKEQPTQLNTKHMPKASANKLQRPESGFTSKTTSSEDMAAFEAIPLSPHEVANGNVAGDAHIIQGGTINSINAVDASADRHFLRGVLFPSIVTGCLLIFCIWRLSATVNLFSPLSL